MGAIFSPETNLIIYPEASNDGFSDGGLLLLDGSQNINRALFFRTLNLKKLVYRIVFLV